MLLQDFIEMALEDFYKASVWDTNEEKVIFTGELHELSEDVLDMTMVSWELLDNGSIQFNVE